MNRSIKLSLASFASALAFAFVAAPAHADEAPANADKPAAPAPDRQFKPFAIEANPLATVVGRYSLQGEWLPAEHHAIVLNPFFEHTSTDIGSYSESFNGFGGEVGYRYYTGSSGANGFFVGPSLIAASYSASTDAPGVGGGSQSFTNLGGAIDVGGQWIVGPGVVVGVGAGLQYTKSSADFKTEGMGLASTIVASGGVRPRMLLSLGYAF